MTHLWMAAALPIVFAAAAPAVAVPPDDELKCATSSRETHYIIDGAFVDIGDDAGATLRTLDGDSGNIEHLAILCWDPVKRVLQRGTGENVVHVTTRTFMVSLHDDLRRIAAAQDAFRTEHGRFAASLADLHIDLETPALEIAMTGSDDGWLATASGELLTISCQISSRVDSLAAREPACATLPRFAPQ